jgi:hypothetical protein
MRTLLFPDETIRHKATSLAGNIVFHFSAKTQIIKQTIATKLTLRSPLRVPPLILLYTPRPACFRDSSLSRSQVKITGVTINTWNSELSMPPSTGVASGFITSAPVRVDHMMGNRPATTVDTVMIFGRRRKRAPSITASCNPCTVSVPIATFFRSTASSR